MILFDFWCLLVLVSSLYPYTNAFVSLLAIAVKGCADKG